MSQEQLHLTYEDAAALLKTAAAEQEWAIGRIRELEEKVAANERFYQAVRIARAMVPLQGEGFDAFDYAEKLASSNEDLHVLERAVALQAENPKLASVAQTPGASTESQAASDYRQNEASQRMNAWLLSDANAGSSFGFPLT